MSNPVILAVTSDRQTADLLGRDVPRRYGSDYQVVVERSPADGLDRLRELQGEGAEVALVLADLRMEGMISRADMPQKPRASLRVFRRQGRT